MFSKIYPKLEKKIIIKISFNKKKKKKSSWERFNCGTASAMRERESILCGGIGM